MRSETEPDPCPCPVGVRVGIRVGVRVPVRASISTDDAYDYQTYSVVKRGEIWVPATSGRSVRMEMLVSSVRFILIYTL